MQWVRTISQLMDIRWKRNSSHSIDPQQSIWNIPPNFLQQKLVILIAKINSSSCNILSQIYLWKSPLSTSNSPILIQKGKKFGLPQNEFWASPTFQSKILSCSERSYIIQYITFKTKFNRAILWRGPHLIINELFPRLGLRCYAFKI